MPGFVDTHQHMAGALFRGLNGDTNDTRLLCGDGESGDVFDAGGYLSRRQALACVSALNAGITTCNDLSRTQFSHLRMR